MSTPKAVAVVVILALASFVWAPWLSEDAARARAVESFTSSWRGVADGCGFNCRGCGVTKVQRQLLGYVSPLGTAHGLPRP
jgi:hypothetical protein